jgi:hypothetical protein
LNWRILLNIQDAKKKRDQQSDQLQDDNKIKGTYDEATIIKLKED